MNYTHVDHNIRHGLGISSNDYYVCDLIFRSQNNPSFSDSGWCTQSYATLAKVLYISVLGCKKSVKKLATLGLIIDSGRKKRVTNIWLVIQETVNKIYQNGNQDGILSIPDLVYRVYHDWYIKYTENGKQSIPHNIKSKIKLNINSSKGGEKVNDLNFSSFKKGITDSISIREKDVSQKKKIPQKKKRVISLVFPFDDTPLSELDYFIAKFTDTDYQFADLEHYFSRLKLWANENDVKLSEAKWLQTAKTFMRRDAEKGNLIRKPELNQHNGKSRQIIDPVQIHRLIKRNSENRGL